MAQKRIALIHPRLVKRGGLETRLLNYIQWFSNESCAVTVYCFKRDRSIELPKDVSVHQYSMSWVPKLYRHRYFSRLLKKENVRAKHDLTLSLGRTDHQDAVLGPGNHIGYLRAFGHRPSSLSDMEQIAMDRKAYESTGTILAASQFMADEIIELFNVKESAVHTLYPPFNPSRFQDAHKVSKSDARRQLGLPEKGVIAGLISSGHKMKGVPMLVEVMAQSSSITLAAAGSPLKTACENIVPLGFIDNPALLLRAADALVLPSVYEAFGQVVVESLYCGTPVIVSENVGAKEVIPTGAGRVIPVGDHEKWKSAIESIAEKSENPEPLIDIGPLSLDSHMNKMCQLVGLKL